VEALKDLGIIMQRNKMTGQKYDVSCVCHGSWAHLVWGGLGHVLKRDHTGLKSMSSIYKAIVQNMLRYGLEIMGVIIC
jgi:hypothetical protein